MIYIQSNTKRTLAHHFDCSCALYGAIYTKMEYRLTSFEEIVSGKFDKKIKSNLFVGTVEFMREVFKRVGIENVRLPENSNRVYEIITLEDAHNKILDGSKLFIKPYEIKLFTGLILDGMQHTCLENLPSDTKVIAYKPFMPSLVSEWRIYVYNNRIEDSRNYSGDFMLSPNYEYVESIINLNKNTFPSTYTIDIGILENDENVVVEYNDMWAIGNYGVPNYIYLKMLKDRYFQIIRKYGKSN